MRSLVLAGATTCLLMAGTASGQEVLRPVEAVRACPRQGAGFVALPGSTACVRIVGRAAAEYGASARRAGRHGAGRVGGATGRISADIRTETPYGPARGFVRLRAGAGRAE